MQHQQYRIVKPPVTRNFAITSVLLGVSWLATVLFEPWRQIVNASLRIDGQTLPQLELWAILTHGIFPSDFVMLFFSVLMLYFFSTESDRRWSSKKWWGTVALALVFGGSLTLLSSWAVGSARPFGGFAAPTYAFVAAYCWSVWNTRVNLLFIELTGKRMLLAFFALDVVFALISMDPTMLSARFGGLLAGLLVAGEFYKLGDLKKRYHYWRVRRNLRVISKTPEDVVKSKKKKRDPKRQREDGTWIN